MHPREETLEDKRQAWESEVIYEEKQVIDSCLESDIGDRDRKEKQEQQ